MAKQPTSSVSRTASNQEVRGVSRREYDEAFDRATERQLRAALGFGDKPEQSSNSKKKKSHV